MIANALAVLIGLWLAYGAIFAVPAGSVNNIELAIAGIVVSGCAVLARRKDAMAWQWVTNVALGIVLVLLAAARVWYGASLSASFWTILLDGIVVAITALWSILYRSEAAPAP